MGLRSWFRGEDEDVDATVTQTLETMKPQPFDGPVHPQVRQCLTYLSMRAYCAPEDEPLAIKRAAVVLLAPPGADAYVRLLGITPRIPEELEA